MDVNSEINVAHAPPLHQDFNDIDSNMHSNGRRIFSRVHGLVETLSGSLITASSTCTKPNMAAYLSIEKKTINSAHKMIERVVQLCLQPALELKNSPPYILDNLPDIYNRLREIVNRYSENYEVLCKLDYFRIFISTLCDKCKMTVKLFKESKDRIFDKKSQCRHRLTKLSLIFSHLLKDLDALFPSNYYSPESFRITKPDAAKWWNSSFEGRAIVPWHIFKTALFLSFGVSDPSQLMALQSTIDLTCNEHVSIFEFDVFVRLFQPWNNILETWKALAVLHPGYMAFMTYDEVKAVLSRYKHHPGSGSYVFRASCTKLGQWAIGYITEDLQILQTIIQNKSLARALLDGEYENFYLYPNGKQSDSSILYQLVHNLPEVHLQVSQEQYQIYCEMGSTFELCKICAENDKDVRLEPCGHLLCKSCLINCQYLVNGQMCPFCRLEIKGVEDIIIDPYKPSRMAYTTCNFKGDTILEKQTRDPHACESSRDSLEPNMDSIFSTRAANNTTTKLSDCTNSLSEETSHNSPCTLASVTDTSGSGRQTSLQLDPPLKMCSAFAMHSGFQITQNPATKINSDGGTDLNYAQLDFTDSESESDNIETASGAQILSANGTYPTVTPIVSSPQIHRSPAQKSSVSTSIISSQIPNTPNCDVSFFGDSFRILLSCCSDLDKDSAIKLLRITGNQVSMCQEIWRHFMPRTNQFS
ncbi:unnamed protein product [Protopolystoma xenopodis]|uniref:E3 ubiquitin-protein ligase CBL n=1 Tax=Protopolystoma xenopodis TaxID=117903 RepID=A0A448WE97_9PLAT|nr:unnamed protein product [Protopolystoma xenopodis]